MSTARRGGLLFFLASAGVNALNFLFQVLVSRSLGPDDYSALGALLAMILIASVPLSAIQLASAQAQARAEAASSIGKPLRVASGAAVAVFAFSLLGAPAINAALHLHGHTLAGLVGGWLAIAIVVTIPQGALIGGSQMRAVAIATFAGTGLSRVLLVAAFDSADAGVNGAMMATVLGQAITLVLLLAPLRSRLSPSGPQLHLKASESALSVAALTGIAALTAFDTVVARHSLSSASAGIYAAAATAGRITLFVSGAIALIVFPRFTAAAQRGESASGLLLRSSLLVAGVGLLSAVILSAFPHLVIRVLFGAEYDAARRFLPILALTGAVLGELNLFCYFHIAAHRSWASLVGWMGAILLGTGVELRHSVDPRSLALTMLGISSACLLFAISAAIMAQPAQSGDQARLPALDLETGTVIPAGRSSEIELR